MSNNNSYDNEGGERVRQWLSDTYSEDEVEAIEHGVSEYGSDEDGFYIELEEKINTDQFAEILQSEEGYGVDLLDESLRTIAAVKEEEVDGVVFTHAYGMTFRNTEKIYLGGYQSPIDEVGTELEPVDNTVEETIDLLRLYLTS